LIEFDDIKVAATAFIDIIGEEIFLYLWCCQFCHD